MNTHWKPYNLQRSDAKKVFNLKNFLIVILAWAICTPTIGTNWIAIIITKIFKIFIEVWPTEL